MSDYNDGYGYGYDKGYEDGVRQRLETDPLLDEMANTMRGVRELIAEAAQTGFNCHDGDWAERLFVSQQKTSAALARYDAMKKERGDA